MNKLALIALPLLLALFAFVAPPKNFYSFSAKDIIGTETSFNAFKGKTILVVNLATKCHLAKQMKDLQALYEQYGEQGFVVLGFPSGSFLKQENGTNDEIKQICTREYGISFPIFEKIAVKGEDMHPVYKFLTQKTENGVADAPVDWNFHKYLIDKNGNVVANFKPDTNPFDPKLVNAIEAELGLAPKAEPSSKGKAKAKNKRKKETESN